MVRSWSRGGRLRGRGIHDRCSIVRGARAFSREAAAAAALGAAAAPPVVVGGVGAAKDDEEHEAAAPSLLALPGGVGAFELLREAADEAELEAGPESLPDAPPTHCKP